jgi:hypothetical protein
VTKPNSVEIWRGPSLLDGAPIVVIASGLRASENPKTGDMLQTYILRADIEPTAAIKNGADVSICGDCVHRGDGTGKGRTCYVNIGQGPLAVWRSWARGNIPRASRYAGLYFVSCILEWPIENGEPCIGKGLRVRLGTYGDPAAVPVSVWQALTKHAIGHTGYTHQWRTAGHELRALCMASVDTVADMLTARASGWRTFRVAFPGQDPRLQKIESRCPASAEAGKVLTCAQCLACGGQNGRSGSVVIAAHGGPAVLANVARRGRTLAGA